MCPECVEMENAAELDSLRMELSDARQEIEYLKTANSIIVRGHEDWTKGNEVRWKMLTRLAKMLNAARRDRDRFERQLDDVREAPGWNC